MSPIRNNPAARSWTPRRGVTTASQLHRRTQLRAAAVVLVCAVAAAPVVLAWAPTDAPLPALDPAARQLTHLSPHVVVYSVPTKKGKGSSTHSDSTHDDGDSGASGDSKSDKHSDPSVSNTVNGHEVGGARTYNNHTDSSFSSASSSGDESGSSSSTGITSSPVQLENNTGAGAGALDPRGSTASAASSGLDTSSSPRTSSTTNTSTTAGSAAPSVMLMRVSCPSSIAAGTVCLQVTSAGGQAASLPASASPASFSTTNNTTSLPTNTTASSLPTDSTSSSAPGAVPGSAPNLSALESQSGKKIELTGYSFQDNQGGNNAKISCPQIHQQAGGTGTYEDPITVASGGKSGGASSDGVKCGDKFYIASVQRYVIVEDTGNTPNKSMPHLDMYVADDPNKSCMNKISGTVTAIPHPPPGLPVLAGPIGNHGSCTLPGGSQ